MNEIEHKGRACREAKFADKQRFRRAGLEPFLAHLNDSVGRLSRNEPLYGLTREATARVVADRTPLLPTTCHLGGPELRLIGRDFEVDDYTVNC